MFDLILSSSASSPKNENRPSVGSKLKFILSLVAVSMALTAPFAMSQTRINSSANLTASPRVTAILRAAHIGPQSGSYRDFLYGLYAPSPFTAPNGLQLPRSGPSLQRAGNMFYRAVFDTPVNSGRNPQFDLPVILRAILGDTTAVIPSWTYSDLVNIALHADANFNHSTPFNPCCRNTRTGVPAGSPATWQEFELAEEGGINIQALRDALRADQVSHGNQLLSEPEAHQLAQIVISSALFGQRNRGGNAEFFSERHLRYQSPSYRDWSKLDIFVGLHPEMVGFYGNYTAVISDPRGRSVDLNAYNHSYYSTPSARVCTAAGCHGGETYYSELLGGRGVDNAEFIMPGSVQSYQIEGLDIRGRTETANGPQTTPQIQLAFRRISLGGGRNAVLVIDPQESNGFRHTCVRLEGANQVPYGCTRENSAQPEGIRNEQPMAVAYARVPQQVGAQLSVIGIYISCPTAAAVGSAQCNLPANFNARYAVRSSDTSPASTRNQEERTRRADIATLSVGNRSIRYISLTTGGNGGSTDSSGTGSSSNK